MKTIYHMTDIVKTMETMQEELQVYFTERIRKIAIQSKDPVVKGMGNETIYVARGEEVIKTALDLGILTHSQVNAIVSKAYQDAEKGEQYED